MLDHIPMHPDMLLLFFTFRFGTKFNRLSENDCWNWTAGCRHNQKGILVPVVHFNNFSYIAARVAYYIQYQKDPGQMLVCHTCDNTLCMNPGHLYLGSHQDNNNDCLFRGRNNPLKGELNGMMKLSDFEVAKLRELWLSGKFTQTELATKFGITRPHVNLLVNHKCR